MSDAREVAREAMYQTAICTDGKLDMMTAIIEARDAEVRADERRLADPRPPIPNVTSIALPLRRQDPPADDITCEVCHSRQPVEWAIEWRANGVVLWSGLHEQCRQALDGGD